MRISCHFTVSLVCRRKRRFQNGFRSNCGKEAKAFRYGVGFEKGIWPPLVEIGYGSAMLLRHGI